MSAKQVECISLKKMELKSSNKQQLTKKFLLHGDEKQIFELKLQIGRGKAKKQPFPGILFDLGQTMKNTTSDSLRARLLTYQVGTNCSSCKGKRLSSFSRSVFLAGKSFDYFLSLSSEKAWSFIRKKVLDDPVKDNVILGIFTFRNKNILASLKIMLPQIFIGASNSNKMGYSINMAKKEQ